MELEEKTKEIKMEWVVGEIRRDKCEALWKSQGNLGILVLIQVHLQVG